MHSSSFQTVQYKICLLFSDNYRRLNSILLFQERRKENTDKLVQEVRNTTIF
jgi:hypothetical protein